MSAILEVQYQRMRSLDLANLEPLPRARNLLSQLQRLERVVSEIRQYLPEAARRSERQRRAKELIDGVTNLSYKLQKILDELEAEARSARKRLGSRKLVAKVRTCFNSSVFTSLRLHKRLERVAFKFYEYVEYAPYFSDSSDDEEQNDGEPAVFGRQKDLDGVVGFVLGDSSHEVPISVLPIVGTAGIGKTTLAKLAFGDDRVVSGFEIRSWVCVSEDFDARQVMKDLIQELKIDIPFETGDSTILHQLLKSHLTDKKFLLVLDHVWGMTSKSWNEFIYVLSCGAPGSKILVTTTDANVANLVGTSSAYELAGLNEQDCWLLLASVAFPDKNPDEYSNLESIGKKMVHKCQGQPLAAKVLGGILKGKMHESEWNDILTSGLWDSSDSISAWDSLFMTYDGLPARLKLCFAYCSIFPKDFNLPKDALIQSWIAESLVLETSRTTTVEMTAGKYFQELLSKSLLELSEGDTISMPALVSHLAQLVSGQACYHLKDRHDYHLKDNKGDHDSPANVRYLSCIYDASTKFHALPNYKNLRSLLISGSPISGRVTYSALSLPNDIFTNFAELRTLSLCGLPLQELPDSIGSLKQLRFLDLSQTLIEKLPDSSSTLFNLLTLRVNNCVYLAELPNMENLINLRHLCIIGSKNIRAMPQGMGGLTYLQSLSNFIVREISGSRIAELKDLVHLSGKLSVSGLQNVADSSDAKDADLAGKTNLDELVLEWNSKFSDLRNGDMERDVLDNLKPCGNLKVLHILYYGGTRFPEWFSLSHNLTSVRLSYCRNCASSPSLGQLPLLKHLAVEGMDGIKSIGAEFGGDHSQGKPFPSLESMEFKDMPAWEEWSSDAMEFEGFPCLRFLVLERCPKLKEFKLGLSALEELTISECHKLTGFSLEEELPKLRELNIQHCPKLKKMPHFFPSLVKFRMWECHELTSLSKTQIDGVASEELTSSVSDEFPLLSELDIQNCTNLKGLPRIFPKLEKLSIRKCKELVSLSIFPKLHDLILEECDELMLGNEVEVSSLASLVICQLRKFQYLRAQLLQCLSCLRNLELSKCENLVALSENPEFGSQALNSVERLIIDGCPQLKQLPDLCYYATSLKELTVLDCQDLEFFPEMRLPPTLKRLVIQHCKNLKALPVNFFNRPDISLEFLEIYGCPSLVSFPTCELPCTLKVLSMQECSNLEYLPAGINKRNTSLTCLRIWNCGKLQHHLNDVGLPCNITSLSIMNCEKLDSLCYWGLDELECLRSFSYGGRPNLAHFKDVVLPDSVSSILLKDLPRLKTLSNVLEGLHSLDILTIRDCPMLEILTGENVLVPPSLSCLYISNCPLLRERYKRDKGQDWPKISHIPLIEFDFQVI